MKRYPLYIFDLDGTLFRGEEAIPHAVETVAELQRTGARIRYVTNNSSQTREFYVQKLGRMGFPAAESEIYSSGIGTAAYLRDRRIENVYVVGEPGLVNTLRNANIRVANAGADDVPTAEEVSAQAVVAGICRSFTYALMSGAMQAIRGGAQFIATNPDATYPLEAGRQVPGAGSIVQAIATCSGQEPFVVGKPNSYLIEVVLSHSQTRPPDALVVGDRVDTDILSGERAGCDVHLVLSGVAHEAPPGLSNSDDLRALLV